MAPPGPKENIHLSLSTYISIYILNINLYDFTNILNIVYCSRSLGIKNNHKTIHHWKRGYDCRSQGVPSEHEHTESDRPPTSCRPNQVSQFLVCQDLQVWSTMGLRQLVGLLAPWPAAMSFLLRTAGVPADQLHLPHKWVPAEQCTFVNPPVVQLAASWWFYWSSYLRDLRDCHCQSKLLQYSMIFYVFFHDWFTYVCCLLAAF